MDKIDPALIGQALADGVELNDPVQVAAWIAQYDKLLYAAKPPHVFPSGAEYQGPLIVPGEASGAFEIWVDTETGIVLSVPKGTKAQKDAAKKVKQDQIKAVKAAKNDADKLAALLLLLGMK
jgi:hypothetical protein